MTFTLGVRNVFSSVPDIFGVPHRHERLVRHWVDAEDPAYLAEDSAWRLGGPAATEGAGFFPAVCGEPADTHPPFARGTPDETVDCDACLFELRRRGLSVIVAPGGLVVGIAAPAPPLVPIVYVGERKAP